MRRFVLLALAMTMAGCSSLDSTGTYASVAGTYSLTRLNGQTLPYTFSNGLTLVADDLILDRDGSYTDVSTYSSGGSRREDGYYSNTNGSIVFQPSTSGQSYQGSITGRVLTEIVGGYTQTFERR